MRVPIETEVCLIIKQLIAFLYLIALSPIWTWLYLEIWFIAQLFRQMIASINLMVAFTWPAVYLLGIIAYLSLALHAPPPPILRQNEVLNGVHSRNRLSVGDIFYYMALSKI